MVFNVTEGGHYMANILPRKIETRTKGERVLIKQLSEALSENWSIFYEPLVNGVRPDIVLFSSKFGILILEVKDYVLSTVRSVAPDFWTLNIEENIKSEKSPLAQVSNYAYHIINELSKNQELVIHSGIHQGKLRLPVLYGCVFTNLSKIQIDLLGISKVIPSELTISADDLKLNIAEKIHSYFSKSFTPSIFPNQSVEIIQFFHPQFDAVDRVNSLIDSLDVKIFPDLVDELLYISTEIRHIKRVKRYHYNRFIIVLPKLQEELIESVKVVLMDMGVPSSFKNEQDCVFLLDLASFHKARETLTSEHVVFIIEIDVIRGEKKNESLLQEIVTTTSSMTMYYSSSRG